MNIRTVESAGISWAEAQGARPSKPMASTLFASTTARRRRFFREKRAKTFPNDSIIPSKRFPSRMPLVYVYFPPQVGEERSGYEAESCAVSRRDLARARDRGRGWTISQ